MSVIDCAYTLAEGEPALSDADQTASFKDQTNADRDQWSSDRDQLASDRDQAASDRDLAAGGDPRVHASSREIRRRNTRWRQMIAQTRLDTTAKRDEITDTRGRTLRRRS